MSLADLLKSNSAMLNAPAAKECAYGYIRVSHERSAEKAISPETQRRRIEAYAQSQGYVITSWYIDLAKSAFHTDADRPEFLRMLSDAKRDPAISVIIIFRYDRFSRNQSVYEQQQDLLRTGVRIESSEEGYIDPDSEMGSIMMPLTWSMARAQSIKIRNVTIPNMMTNFEQRDPETGWAYKNGGWPQFGYASKRIPLGRNTHGHDIHKMIWALNDTCVDGKPIHEWARTLLLDWRLRERLGYDAIAARLTSAKIPTAMGRAVWSPSSVQCLVADWTRLYQYTGIAFWNREDCHTDKHNRRQRDPSEWIVVPNAHPAIITEGEADAIWAMVASNTRTRKGKKAETSRWALSGGLLKCAICGANYAGTVIGGKDYYACGAHLYRRGEGCHKPAWYIRREDIEQLALSKIQRAIPTGEAELADWVSRINAEVDAEWQALRKTAPDRRQRIKTAKARLKNIANAISTIGPQPDLLEEMQRLSSDVARLERMEATERPEPLDIAGLHELSKRVSGANNSPETVRQVLREFVIEIIADSQTRTLQGKMINPSSIVANYMAAPTGVEPVLRP